MKHNRNNSGVVASNFHDGLRKADEFYKRMRFDLARLKYMEALEVGEDYRFLAAIHLKIGKCYEQEAWRIFNEYKEVAEYKKEEDEYKGIASSCNSLFSEAIDEYRKSMLSFYKEACWRMGFVSYISGSYEEAIIFLKKAVKGIKNPLVYSCLGWAYAFAGHYQEAYETFTLSIQKMHRRPELFHYKFFYLMDRGTFLAQYAVALKDKAQGILDLKKALWFSHDPRMAYQAHHWKVYYALGQLYEGVKELQVAFEYYEMAFEYYKSLNKPDSHYQQFHESLGRVRHKKESSTLPRWGRFPFQASPQGGFDQEQLRTFIRTHKL